MLNRIRKELLAAFYNHNVLFAPFLAPCKVIRIPESWKYLFVESGILSFGIRKSGIQVPLAGTWNPPPGIRNPKREIHDPRLYWSTLHGTFFFFFFLFFQTLFFLVLFVLSRNFLSTSRQSFTAPGKPRLLYGVTCSWLLAILENCSQ